MDSYDLPALINHWCPKGPAFDREDMNVRLVRALMSANACVMQHDLVAKGKRPIRPLSDFPKAYAG